MDSYVGDLDHIDHQPVVSPSVIRKKLIASIYNISQEVADEFKRLVLGGEGVDQSVQLMAIQMHLDRTLGKAGDLPQGSDAEAMCRANMRVDLLTQEEQEQLHDLLQGVAKFERLTQERAARA